MAQVRKLVATAAAAVAVVAVSAVPGSAADAQTPATLTISSTGGLGVSAPSSTVNLGSVQYSSSSDAVTWPTTAAANPADALAAVTADISGQLGNVTVTDSRTGILPSWTASVSWTDFKLEPGSSTTDEIIEIANIRYLSGATSSTIDPAFGAFVPSLLPVSSGGTGASFTGVGLTGSTVVWNPTIFVDVQGEKAGTYEGTITHSVTAS